MVPLTGERLLDADTARVTAVPVMTWRPSTGSLVVAASCALLTAVVFIPWWSERTSLGLALITSVPVTLILLSLAISRQSAVLQTYAIIRTPELNWEASTAVAGIRGGDLRPEGFVAVFTLSVVMSAWDLISGTPVRQALLPLVVLGGAALLIFALAWRLSPWFRVRWSLLRATWSVRTRREVHLARALSEDPGNPGPWFDDR